ncbi:MAG: protoporphyrinogen oxidase [Deltaproteobacteria bacterium]|nr:protoporphyrinogen oxidase [Deltaproteobacteria bacterium]
MSESACDVAIVGAGVTGLVAALLAQRAGARVRLFEQSTCGGLIQSARVEGFTLECGPNVFVERPEFLSLLQSIGLTKDIEYPVFERPRQLVYSQGAFHQVPDSPLKALRTPLLEGAAKRKALFAMLRNKYPGKLTSDVSVAEFFLPLIGRRGVDKILEPALRGIYGGECERLSSEFLFPLLFERIKQSGKLRSGARAKRPKAFRLRGGNDKLSRALEQVLQAQTVVHSRVTSLSRDSEGFTLTTDTGQFFRSASVVLSAGNNAAELLAGFDAALAADLQKVPAVGLEVLHVAVDALLPSAQGAFGMLLPAESESRVLGIMFSSHLFPSAAPPGQELLTICLRPASAGTACTPAESLREARYFISKVSSCEPRVLKQTIWPCALPKYCVGHMDMVRRARALEARVPGLFLIGRDVGKPGVSDRVSAAFQWMETWKTSQSINVPLQAALSSRSSSSSALSAESIAEKLSPSLRGNG